MKTTSKTKSRFNQVLLKIDAKSLHENNQQKCIDCLKQRSKKNKHKVKKFGYNGLYASKFNEDSYL